MSELENAVPTAENVSATDAVQPPDTKSIQRANGARNATAFWSRFKTHEERSQYMKERFARLREKRAALVQSASVKPKSHPKSTTLPRRNNLMELARTMCDAMDQQAKSFSSTLEIVACSRGKDVRQAFRNQCQGAIAMLEAYLLCMK